MYYIFAKFLLNKFSVYIILFYFSNSIFFSFLETLNCVLFSGKLSSFCVILWKFDLIIKTCSIFQVKILYYKSKCRALDEASSICICLWKPILLNRCYPDSINISRVLVCNCFCAYIFIFCILKGISHILNIFHLSTLFRIQIIKILIKPASPDMENITTCK